MSTDTDDVIWLKCCCAFRPHRWEDLNPGDVVWLRF